MEEAIKTLLLKISYLKEEINAMKGGVSEGMDVEAENDKPKRKPRNKPTEVKYDDGKDGMDVDKPSDS